MAQIRNNGSDDLTILRDDLGRISNKVTELVRGQSANMREAVEDGREALGDKARDWTKAGASALGEAQNRVMHAKSDIETRIERNPFAALLIAAGIGLMFGLITRDRH